MIETLVAVGLAGLALAAFLAGSVLPFPSEAVLAALVANGGDPVAHVVVASVANTLGAVTLLAMGRGGERLIEGRLDERGRARLNRAQHHVRRYGAVALVLAWLPVVGDAFVLAGGLLRIPWGRAIAAVAAGKTLRYAAVVWGVG